jgi:hypothetical protein
VVAGPEDVAGYKSVVTAASEAKDLRLKIEAKRKELKAPALLYGEKVDAHAKQLSTPIVALETELKAKKQEIDTRREQLAREKERKRWTDLQSVGFAIMGQMWVRGAVMHPFDNILKMSDADFEKLILETQAQIAREKEEAEIRRVEAEKRAADERAEQAEKKARADAAARELAELEAKLAQARAELAAAQKPVAPVAEPKPTAPPAQETKQVAAPISQAPNAPAQQPAPAPSPEPKPAQTWAEPVPSFQPDNFEWLSGWRYAIRAAFEASAGYPEIQAAIRKIKPLG